MASYFPDPEARLRAQEALTSMIHAQIHGVAASVSDKADKREVAELRAIMEKGFADLGQLIKAGFESVDQRFTHIYGELADIKSNVAEVRNTVAGLVQREQGPYSPEEK